MLLGSFCGSIFLYQKGNAAFKVGFQAVKKAAKGRGKVSFTFYQIECGM